MTRDTSLRRAPLMLALAALTFSAGCASTVRIERLLGEPHRYDGRTVQVEGRVTRSAGILGMGAFEVDDGTGKIFVIAQGQGVPAEGTQTRVKGRFESVFNLGRTAVAAIVQERRF